MTNTELIRQEIEKRIALYDTLADAAAEKNLHNTLEANELLINTYKGFLSFIDSLPDETPQGLDEAAKEFRFFDFGTADEIAQAAFKAGAKWQRDQIPQGWISVKDRLPENDDYVLTCDNDINAPYISLHFYKDGKWWDDDKDYDEPYSGVIDYWMPIPKFKEE